MDALIPKWSHCLDRKSQEISQIFDVRALRCSQSKLLSRYVMIKPLMWSLVIVESDIIGQFVKERIWCLVQFEINIFVLDTFPKTLVVNVVNHAANTVHANRTRTACGFNSIGESMRVYYTPSHLDWIFHAKQLINSFQ